MKQLTVDLKDDSYSIIIHQGLYQHINQYLIQIYQGKKLAIITDEHVDALYGQQLYKQLSQHYQLIKIVLPPGEQTKTFHQLTPIYEQLIDGQLTRSDAIIAFGGGVIGDIAGFIAATYLRGVAFIQIPTTLLAQVDSSVGGKVGVDLSQGKNLVGAFYQPMAVFIDPLMLQTLSDNDFNSGMAEVIKYGCILDAKLFDQLEQLNSRDKIMTQIDEIIWRCCDLKRQVVEQDEKDKGERLKLNYGHTFGHALEAATNYLSYSHGQAISIGMNIINQISSQLSQMDKQRITQLLTDFHLPTTYTKADIQLLLPYLTKDKKILNHQLKLIKLITIGQSTIDEITLENLIVMLGDNDV